MKILMLPHYWRNPYQRELADALRRADTEVTLVYADRRTSWSALMREHGKPDVLHLHWTHQLLRGDTALTTSLRSTWLLARLALFRAAGIRVVWTLHNLGEHEQRYPALEVWTQRLLARLCHRIIVHCEAAKELAIQSLRLGRRHVLKLVTIPHGHYISSYPVDVDVDEATARQLLDIDPSAFVYLFLGQIRDYKAVPDLIEAFRHIDDDRTRLIIAGRPASSSLVAKIRQQTKGDERIITYLGYVEDDAVQLYMKAADVVVTPFSQVLTSGSVILAMSFAKPVIAPKMACVAELLQEPRGFGYDPDEPNALAELMARVAKIDLQEVGRDNYEFMKQLDWDGVAEATLGTYSQ